MNTPSPDWPDEATRTPGARLVVRRDADTLTIAYVVEAADGSINAQLATGDVVPADQIRDLLAGRLRKENDAALTRLGPTFTYADERGLLG